MSALGLWLVAVAHPERTAVIDVDGASHTFGELGREANRLVHALRAWGLGTGDCVAYVLSNRWEVFPLFGAAHQAGWFLTPLNHHLTAAEMAWILADSGAKAVVTEGRYADVARAAAVEAGIPAERVISVDGVGGVALESVVEGHPDTAPADRAAGATMTYTSGTTGRPKGVRRATMTLAPEQVSTGRAGFLGLFGILPGSAGVHLVVAPLYHTAVVDFATNFLHLGHTVVLMDKWTPEGMLDRIQRYRVTSSHMVPTQFIRLLKLPDEVRLAYDVSSVSHMIHGAAPCPVEVKRRMIEWWGDAVIEYYAASEGGGTLVRAREWMERPGTVGRPWPISQIHILDDAGEPVPTGTPGTVWIRMGDFRFEYHNDAAKTREAWREGLFTVGDAGYLDADGYLFLCDRKADMIISGGVNLYPAEIEAVLVGHPKVVDVAVIGVPDEDWGEAVRAVVQPAEGVEAGPALEAELLAYCEGRLARFKQPRSLRFTDALPRDPNGKLYKRRVRELFGG